MMSFNARKILWVEDNPSFVNELKGFSGGKLTDSRLQEAVEWAFCYNDALDKVRNGTYDLHILDGDFPQYVPDERREYLQRALRGELDQLNFQFDDGRKWGRRFNDFKRLYLEALRGKRTIVYSLSDDALRRAYELGLPFYSKRHDTKKQVLEFLKTFRHGLTLADVPRIEGMSEEEQFDKMMSDENMDNWEHGSTKELVERYLIR